MKILESEQFTQSESYIDIFHIDIFVDFTWHGYTVILQTTSILAQISNLCSFSATTFSIVFCLLNHFIFIPPISVIVWNLKPNSLGLCTLILSKKPNLME